MKEEKYAAVPALLTMIPVCQGGDGDSDWFPPVDILEDADEYLFRIDLPETRPDDVEVVVEEDGLFISGERPKPPLEGKKFLRLERPHGRFERRFALPDDASRTEVSSAFSDSVLELHVRKLRPLGPKPAAASTTPKLRLRRGP